MSSATTGAPRQTYGKESVETVFWGVEYVIVLALSAALGAEMTYVIRTSAWHALTGLAVRVLTLFR